VVAHSPTLFMVSTTASWNGEGRNALAAWLCLEQTLKFLERLVVEDDKIYLFATAGRLQAELDGVERKSDIMLFAVKRSS
jgi:hypothetical protein